MDNIDKNARKCIFTTFDGREVMYTIRLLKSKRALRLYHTTLSSIVSMIGSIAGKGDVSKIASALDFETIEYLANELLTNAVVRPDGPTENSTMFTLTDPVEADYYLDNQDELYLAIWEALKANYPKRYALLRTKLKDSAFVKKLETLK